MCVCGEWSVERAGPGPRLRVTGRCTCPRAGHQLELAPAADQLDPAVLVLELTVVRPEFAAEVITTHDLVWEGDAGGDVAAVEVRPLGGLRGGATVTVPGG